MASDQAPVSAMVNRARIERVVSILSTPTTYDRQTPALAIPLQLLEGGTNTVPRAPALLVKQIVRGRTRTILDTSFAPLQGEWLEAVDVEEYLEERGICLRNTISSGVPFTANIIHQAPVPRREQNMSSLVLPWLVGGREASPDESIPPQLQSMRQRPAVSISTEFRGHEPPDYSAFGLSKPSRSLPHIKLPIQLLQLGPSQPSYRELCSRT
ncbi:hypothetical protein BKA61DRAFT_582955 [Leptodontidium sp. MPI-SDFR-AT-0119]|nr:hypothetical protein BKA61DRAFT_582955 [Leptodontidium sp. MPI-SDFR-AT-0119]